MAYDERIAALNAKSGDLMAEGLAWLDQERAARGADKTALLPRGHALARRLRSHMIDLSSSKALESSPDIARLVLMAAKVALHAFGADSPQLEPYERDVYHYKGFDTARALVEEYDSLKAAIRRG